MFNKFHYSVARHLEFDRKWVLIIPLSPWTHYDASVYQLLA